VLDRVSFKNFKSLKAVTIELAPLTVLVGPNGSGKSSVLFGIHYLSQLGSPKPVPIHSDAFSETVRRSNPRRLASNEGPITIELSVRDTSGDELSAAIVVPAPDVEDPRSFEFSVSVDGVAGRLASKTNGSAFLEHPRRRRFASLVYLHLDAAVMSRTSATDEEEPRMAPDGQGLASTLAWLAGAKPEVLQWIAAALGRVVPGVRRILIHRERLIDQTMDKVTIDGQPVWRPVERSRLGDRFSIEFDDGTVVPADLLSEGTVLALGLLTKLHEPERPKVLLLDDIDRGLHIGAQAKLVAVLRDLMRLDPELQIVCTTHSAYLLDLFDPSEVRVLDLDTSRATHAKPLTAHPEFDKWRFGTQTGELWAALGDAWVTKQSEDPAP
jgi:predicted ATPase